MTPLTQSQTEALVRLLILAKFQDGLISLAEDARFRELVEGLPWDTPKAIEIFVDHETARVRQALGSPSAREALLREQCACFETPESRRLARERITAVLDADGRSPAEERLLAELLGHLPA